MKANVTRLISWLIMIPLAVAVVIFTIANRADVGLDLWPMPLIIDVPLFSVGLVAGFVGFFGGALIAWLSGAHRRGLYRKLVRQLEAAKREEKSLRDRLEHIQPLQTTKLAAPTALSPVSKTDAA